MLSWKQLMHQHTIVENMLALSFVSGCPGRGVPAFLGCHLRVHAQLPVGGCAPMRVLRLGDLDTPARSAGLIVSTLYTLYARRRCISVVIFVQSIMLIFAPPYLMFKTIAEHKTDIASEYKLTHRKVCEFICGISRHHDTYLNFKKYSSTVVYWIYLITFSMMKCSWWCDLCYMCCVFYIMIFNAEGPMSYASLPSLSLITSYSHYVCILYIFEWWQ